jgi:hypothetical protein
MVGTRGDAWVVLPMPSTKSLRYLLALTNVAAPGRQSPIHPIFDIIAVFKTFSLAAQLQHRRTGSGIGCCRDIWAPRVSGGGTGVKVRNLVPSGTTTYLRVPTVDFADAAQWPRTYPATWAPTYATPTTTTVPFPPSTYFPGPPWSACLFITPSSRVCGRSVRRRKLVGHTLRSTSLGKDHSTKYIQFRKTNLLHAASSIIPEYPNLIVVAGV